jgi:hypothetical protein
MRRFSGTAVITPTQPSPIKGEGFVKRSSLQP